MTEDKTSGPEREVFISYLDDANNVVNGFVILIEQTANYVKFKTNANTITISYSRLIKIKEKGTR